MVLPNIIVRVEPGDGTSVFYLPLSPESKSTKPMSRVGLYLSIKNSGTIKNNGTYDIHLNQVSVSFPNNSQYDKPFTADLDIPRYKTKPWKMRGGENIPGGESIYLPFPPPGADLLQLTYPLSLAEAISSQERLKTWN